MEPAPRSEHPCIPGWKSDAEFYVCRAQKYIGLAQKFEPGDKVRDYNINAAEYMIRAAETCIEKMEKVTKNGYGKSS